LCIAGVLLQFGASLNLEDSKGRTPIDLLSGPVSQANGDSPDSGSITLHRFQETVNLSLILSSALVLSTDMIMSFSQFL
jgi:hypothetical protein